MVAHIRNLNAWEAEAGEVSQTSCLFLFLGQIFYFFILIYVDVCLPACLYVYHMNVVSEEAKKRVLDPLKFHITVSHSIWVPGIESRFLKSTSALNS